MPVQPIIPPEWGWAYDIAVGQEWPQADEDALRRIAQAWTDAMEALLTVAGGGNAAAQNVNYSVQSVSSDEFNNYWSAYVDGDNSVVGQMARQCENLATQCLAFAEQTEFTKLSIDIQLILLFIQLAIDIVLAFVTFGASTSEGVLAAFITRLTVRGFLTELLKAVLMAVLPDVITQVIMLSEGHRSSFDVGETLQAAQMGVIGGVAGAGLGAGLGRLGTTDFFDSVAGKFLSEDASKFAGGVTNAAVHGALTNLGTNMVAGTVDSAENQIHAALDPEYARELQQQTRDQGYADQKSGENPLIAALNGAFTGALFHTVHEGSFALAGNTFGATPLTLTDGDGNAQRFTALPMRDGSDGSYALFDQNNQFVGKGTVDDNGAVTVTPNTGSPYSAQVVTLGDQKFGPDGTPSGPPTDPPAGPTELASQVPQQPALPGAEQQAPTADHPATGQPVSSADQVPGAQTPPAQPVYPETAPVPVDQQPLLSPEQPAVSPEQSPVAPEQHVEAPGEQLPTQVPVGSQPAGPDVAVTTQPVGAPGSTDLSSVPPQPVSAAVDAATAVPNNESGTLAQSGSRADTADGTAVTEQPDAWFPFGAEHPESGLRPGQSASGGLTEPTQRDMTPRRMEDLERTPTVPLSWDRPLVFTDTGEAMAYAERVWGDAISRLTPEQKAALMAYTGEAIMGSADAPSYQSINRYLRGRIPATPEILDGIARIDEALALRPVPENLVVNRTTNAHVFAGAVGNPVENPADLPGLVGSVQRSASYLSAHFGAYHPGGEEVALHLAIPEGTPALYLGTISVDPSQHELLLGRGLSWQIDRVWAEPTGLGGDTWHVQAHVLPGHPADVGYTRLGAEDRPAGEHAEIQSVVREDGHFRITVASGEHTAELLVEVDHDARRVVLSTDDENGDILREFSGKVRRVPGMFDVFGHADPNGLLVDGMRLPFQELDKLPLGIPEDAAIRLFGCRAGAGDAIAELARATGRDVIAADTDVWIDKNGNVIAAAAAGPGGGAQPDFGPSGTGDGSWQVVHPDGSRETLSIDDPRHPPPPPDQPARTGGGPGWSHDASQQELASRQPRIPPDQFWEEQHATESYVVSYDDSRALYKPETGVWRGTGDTRWAGDRLYHEIWQDAHLWAEVGPDDIRYTRELAAYGTDRMLGFNLVPTTAERAFDTVGPRGTGSVQEWVPGGESQRVGSYPPPDQQRMAVLDYVLANSDRNPGNYLTGPDGRPVAIDHGETFPVTGEEGITSQFAGAWLDKPLSPEVLDQVRAVDLGAFRDMLLARGITEHAAGGAVARLREIQEDGVITGRAYGGDIHSPQSWFALGEPRPNRVTRPLAEVAPDEPFRLTAPAGHFEGFTVSPGGGPHLATEPYLGYPEVFADPADVTPADWQSWLRDLSDCMTQRDPASGAHTEWMLALHQSDDGWHPVIYRGDLFSVQPPDDALLLIHTHIIGSPEGQVPSAGDWLALRNSGLSHGYVLTYSASDAAPGGNRMRILRIGYEGPPADGRLAQEVFPSELRVPEPVNDYRFSLQRAARAREAIATGGDIARGAAAELDEASRGIAGIFGRPAVPDGLDALRGALARVAAAVDNPAQAEAALAELDRFADPDQRLWAPARQELRAALSHAQAAFYSAEEQTRVSLLRDDPATRARAEDAFNYVRSLRFGTPGEPMIDRAMAEDRAMDEVGLTGTPRYRDALAELTSNVAGRATFDLPDSPELQRLRALLSAGEPPGEVARRLVAQVRAHGFDALDPDQRAQYHALLHVLGAWHGYLTEDASLPVRNAEIRGWVPEGDHFLVELFDGERASLMRADRAASGWVFGSLDADGDLLRRMASAVLPGDTVINLFGHADAEGILIGRTRVPFAEMGEKLLDFPEGSTVRLHGCEAGAGERIAELARVTGCDVVAADTPVWVDRHGNVVASSEVDENGRAVPFTGHDGRGDGRWTVIHPDGTREPLAADDPRAPRQHSPFAPEEFLRLARTRHVQDLGFVDEFASHPPDSELARLVRDFAVHLQGERAASAPENLGRWTLLADVPEDSRRPAHGQTPDSLNAALARFADEYYDNAKGAIAKSGTPGPESGDGFEQFLRGRFSRATGGDRQTLIAVAQNELDEARQRLSEVQSAPQRFRDATAALEEARRNNASEEEIERRQEELRKARSDAGNKAINERRAQAKFDRAAALLQSARTPPEGSGAYETGTSGLPEYDGAGRLMTMIRLNAELRPGDRNAKYKLQAPNQNDDNRVIELVNVRGVPVTVSWGEGGKLGFTHVPEALAYDDLRRNLTGLRGGYPGGGEAFDKLYAKAILELARPGGDICEVPGSSLRSLCEQLFGAAEADQFFRSPEKNWHDDGVGSFVREAAALGVLHVGLEGAREPSTFITNLMAWDLVSDGRLSLDDCLGYFNLMGPDNSVQVGRLVHLYNLGGQPRSDDFTGTIGTMVGKDLADQAFRMELAKKFPEYFNEDGTIKPGGHAGIARMQTMRTIAEFEFRQREILALYAVAHAERLGPLAAGDIGLVELNKFFYSTPGQSELAVRELAQILWEQLGWIGNAA